MPMVDSGWGHPSRKKVATVRRLPHRISLLFNMSPIVALNGNGILAKKTNKLPRRTNKEKDQQNE